MKSPAVWGIAILRSLPFGRKSRARKWSLHTLEVQVGDQWWGRWHILTHSCLVSGSLGKQCNLILFVHPVTEQEGILSKFYLNISIDSMLFIHIFRDEITPGNTLWSKLELRSGSSNYNCNWWNWLRISMFGAKTTKLTSTFHSKPFLISLCVEIIAGKVKWSQKHF